MSETEGQEEPTMEEILASIRKIISEDDVEEGASAEPSEASEELEPEGDITLDDEDEDDQVLELTEMVEEEPEAIALEDETEEDVEIDAAPEPESEPVVEPEIDISPEVGIDDVDPATGEDVLMSEAQSDFTMDQFGVLSDLLTSGYQGAGNTLEDLVREMLRPMLREWLDKNLPGIVERMIAKEIARLARTKKP